MQKLVTGDQIRDYETRFIQSMGKDASLTLMEKAGEGLAEVIKEYQEPYLIVCGRGNNGGDGIVAARHLYTSGKNVQIVLTSHESSLSSDSKANFNLIKNTILYTVIDGQNINSFKKILKDSNTVVDCLIGTGIQKKTSAVFESIIKMINGSKKDIIACDIPSGLDPNTGNVSENTIKAKITVTFGYPKIGLLVYPGKKCTGTIKTIDIGLGDLETSYFLLDDDFLSNNFPTREEDSNKGTFGRTILVCGSRKFPGAALLASKGASGIGSGLTGLASKEEVLNKVAPVMPEITHIDFNLSTILEESLNSSVLVIGPGLTTGIEIKELVERLIKKANVPIVLDADGINVLAGGEKEIIKKAKREVVLTPHPKEFARLLGISVEEVLNNKVELVKKIACELNCIVVLKGPGTIIATKEGKLFISPFANAALAKGGTGDVLAGFIGGLIAQGLPPYLAACVGVYIHGKTAEIIAQEKTVFSLFPQDLISYLPKAIKKYV